MANVIKTVLTYQLDGSNRDFNIPFEYLARKFVAVTLIGVDSKVLTINADYRFATRTTISLTKAWGPADGYTTIELRRVTSTTDRLVDFTDGSILRAYDLNVAQIQTMHVAEEARDLTADNIGVNNDGHLDARGRRIVNIGEGVNAGDAVTMGQIHKWNDSALNSANRAKAEADRATQQADRALAQANRAESEANRALGNADEAFQHKEKAKEWAVKETPVEGELQSSRTYAIEARSHRDAAKVSEDSAKVSETNAKTSEANAAASAATAKGEADRSTSEADRSTSEADRAKSEADKLENNNKLAGAIDTIPDNNEVNWKSPHWFPYGVRTYVNGDKGRFAGWNAYPLGDDATAVELVVDHPDSRKAVFTYRNSDNVIQWGAVDVSIGMGRSEVREQNWVIGNGWAGSGLYEQQHANNDAPFMKRASYAAPADASVYLPIVKGTAQVEGHGYAGSYSFGMLAPGGAQFPKGNIVFCGDAGQTAIWTFDPNGSFSANGNIYTNSDVEGGNVVARNNLIVQNPGRTHIVMQDGGGTARAYFYKDPGTQLRINNGADGGGDFEFLLDGSFRLGSGAHVYSDGNIWGNAWGGTLIDWVNNNFQARAGHGVNRGWAEVWSGRAGGGATMWLNQDIRFRQCWIRINGRLVPQYFGNDEEYHVQGWGPGWIHLRLQANGTQLVNIQDSGSVPTQIIVQN